MTYYKLIKWVQLYPGHKREYILPIKASERKQYLKDRNVISNTFIEVSRIKYVIFKLLYGDNIREYWEDQKIAWDKT